jgi:hypothetical protein
MKHAKLMRGDGIVPQADFVPNAQILHHIGA